MRRNRHALGTCPSGRAGMTLLEVLAGMAIFMVGSVSIVGLFVTASVLHAEAGHRRTTSFIMQDLLAQVRAMPMREVYATTMLAQNCGVADVTSDVLAGTPDLDYQAASFYMYPVHPLFDPRSDAAGGLLLRYRGPILIEGQTSGVPAAGSEWTWYSDITFDINADGEDRFDLQAVDRWLWRSGAPGEHTADTDGDGFRDRDLRVLSPRTWLHVQDDQLLFWPPLPPPAPLRPDDTDIEVYGDPMLWPAGAEPLPPQGYLVIDEEWIRYTGWASLGAERCRFFWNVSDDDRGWGGTEMVTHEPGTPVTVAREHPYYPGYYYTVQFYPVNATGAESHVVISVGYGNPQAFRVHTVRTIYSPQTF